MLPPANLQPEAIVSVSLTHGPPRLQSRKCNAFLFIGRAQNLCRVCYNRRKRSPLPTPQSHSQLLRGEDFLPPAPVSRQPRASWPSRSDDGSREHSSGRLSGSWACSACLRARLRRSPGRGEPRLEKGRLARASLLLPRRGKQRRPGPAARPTRPFHGAEPGAARQRLPYRRAETPGQAAREPSWAARAGQPLPASPTCSPGPLSQARG